MDSDSIDAIHRRCFPTKSKRKRRNSRLLQSSSIAPVQVLAIAAVALSRAPFWNGCLVGASSSFEPYELNGGLVSAVAGEKFCIIACDTRRMGGNGYLLTSRNQLASRLAPVDCAGNDGREGGLFHFHGGDVDEDSSGWMQNLQELLLRESATTTKGWLKSVTATMEKRITKQQPRIFLATSGCIADCTALQRVIRSDLKAALHYFYAQSYSSPAPTASGSPKVPVLVNRRQRQQPHHVAALLSHVLYLRRGFPYYAFCVLAGLSDDDGNGKVYAYDAIGSYEQVAVATAGTGRELLQPVLDRLFASTMVNSKKRLVDGTSDEAVRVLCQAYRSVSEREIGVGDRLVVVVLETISEDEHASCSTYGNGEIEPAGTQTTNCRVMVIPLKQH